MTQRIPKILPLILIMLLLAGMAQAQDGSWPHPTPYEPGIDEMIGQMLLAGFRDTAITDDSPIARDIGQYHLGGVVLFNRDVVLGKGPRNIESPQQLRELTAALQKRAKASRTGLPLIISIDQEGGKVQRLRLRDGFNETPAPAELAAPEGEACETVPAMSAGLAVGRQLFRFGINLDFAPALDLNVNPDNPIIGKLGRSFGATPEKVIKFAGAFAENMRSEGILSCVKHFPGHGSSTGDSHLGVTDVTATWTEAELEPFAAFIKEGRADMVMTAHLFNEHWDPDHPATLSRKVITNMLRGKLGYNGVVITDDMNMGAITEQYGLEEAIFLAIDAGCDILLFGNNLTYDADIVPRAHGIIKHLVETNRLSENRLQESYRRITALKRQLQ